MKKRVIKIFDKVILLLLGFSGAFYSCAKYGERVAEFVFHVEGKVTDKETTKPIQNIQISKYGGTLYTDTE